MTEPRLGVIWNEVQSELAPGWHIDSLRCASIGLEPQQRSDEWIGMVVADDGRQVQSQASTPAKALRGLTKLTWSGRPANGRQAP
jgi:hypothetical protein